MSVAMADEKRLHLATHSGWYRFAQKGTKWVPVDRALTYWSATCLAVDPADPGLVYVGTERSGLFLSYDGGSSWQRAEPNVPRLAIFSLLALSGTILVGTVPAALYRKELGGWKEMEEFRRGTTGGSFPPNPDLGARTRYLAVDPVLPERLYAGIEVGGLFVSDDGGVSWSPANEGLSDPDVHQVRACARSRGLVLAACGEEGVFRSPDRGAHWEKVTPAGPRTYGTAVAEDNQGALYLGLARGRPNSWLRSEGAEAAILRSSDRGAHWETAAEGIHGAVMDFCACPDGEGVFAGTSEGQLLFVNSLGRRVIATGLPCITALALGA
jgi:photosystem II stability/assembly factor-like uncharacterized protein